MGFDINKFVDEHKKELITYWDYRDSLSEEQIMKVLETEDGLCDIEMEVADLNNDCTYEAVKQILQDAELVIVDSYDNIPSDVEVSKAITEEDYDELKCELECNWDINIDGLLRNSYANIRVTLLANEDFIYMPDFDNSETVSHFKKVFAGAYKEEELEHEQDNNMGTDYNHFAFYFRISGKDILRLREWLMAGKIELTPEMGLGLFNYWVGAGSVLEMNLTKSVVVSINDWTNTGSKYYPVRVELDSNNYGIKQTYGLSDFHEVDVSEYKQD